MNKHSTRDFEMISRDGLRLCGRSWEPESAVHAVVCLVHGLGEHCGRYDHVADVFCRSNVALLTFDLRGHGRSDGRRGHAPGYDRLMSDIDLLLHEAAVRYPELPCFLYGQSLGGNLVLYHVLKRNPSIAGVVATAPLLQLAFDPPTWKTALLQVLNVLHLTLSIPSGLDDVMLSRDLNIVRLYRYDPLTHHRVSSRLALDMLRHGQWLMKQAAAFPRPLLLMHGDADRITSSQASASFASRAGPSCTLKIWKGFYHELHNEPGKDRVLDTILHWIRECI